MKGRPDRCIWCGQINKADVFLQGNRWRSAGNLTNLATMHKGWIVIACNILSEHFKANQASFQSVLFLLKQCFTAYEVRLFKLYDPTETRFKQGRGSIDVVTV